MEQLGAMVIGPHNSGKSQLISTAINVPLEKFNNNNSFQELKNENIPISFIEVNDVTITELQNELEVRSKNSAFHICWYVLPGSAKSLTNSQLEEIACLNEYFDKIIYVFTDVTKMLSSDYIKTVAAHVNDPTVVLIASTSNTDSVITYESSLTQLINFSFSVIPPQFHEYWQILVDLRQRRIYHGIENKPERINFNGMELIVQDTDIGHLNIVIAGQSGAGKSCLINTILGKTVSEEGTGNSVTRAIQEYDIDNMPITIIDSPGFELGDAQQNYNNILNMVNQRKVSKNVSHHIHMMWYCINESACRVQDIDTNIILQISKIIPVIIVLTKAIIKQEPSDKKTVMESLKSMIPGAVTYADYVELSKRNAKRKDFINLSKSNVVIHRLVARPIELINGYVQCAYGLQEFIELHKYYLPQISQYVLNTSQEIEFETKRAAAKNYITQYSQIIGMSTNKPVIASDAKKYKPLIQNMLVEVSRVLDIPIQEGSIFALSENLFEEKKDSYGTFKDVVGFFMGFAETALSSTRNPILTLIGKGIGIIRNLLFPANNDAPSLHTILNTIGNNYLETISILKKNKRELNLENFMKVYSENIKNNE